MNPTNRVLVIASALALLLLPLTTIAPASATPSDSQQRSADLESVQTDVNRHSLEQLEEKRKEITDDAVSALEQSYAALKALESGSTKDALAALEIATGKLELVLARNPSLGLVPVDIQLKTQDLWADAGAIENTLRRAKRFLNNGMVQEARPLVANLASEIVVRSTNIPLATYPAAIKEVVRLLDNGKTEEAKAALTAVLDTLVVTTDAIIPLPKIRAELLLAKAEKLATKEDRTEEEGTTLENLITAAQNQLEIAELLGYGDAKAYASMYEELKGIRELSAQGKSGEGWFEKILDQISDLF